MTFEGVPGLVERREEHGETTLVVDPARLKEACLHLRDVEGFNFLSDITPTDYLGWGRRGVAGYYGTEQGRDLNSPSGLGVSVASQAHARVRALIARLVAAGKARDRSVADHSNIYWLEMEQALAERAFTRGREAGVRIGRWQDGRIPVFANTTLLRRPLDEYVALFLG